MVVVMPSGRAFTVDDLDGFPSDGNRYELIEGSLHVTPVPAMPHQRAVQNVFRVLDRSAPPDLAVWLSPLDVVLSSTTVLQPDVFVLPAATPDTARVTTVPPLAVEVLSPSSRSYDLVYKQDAYRQAGVGAYLVVDPLAPSITAWPDLSIDGPPMEVTGDEPLRLDAPFPVTLVPAALVT